MSRSNGQFRCDLLLVDDEHDFRGIAARHFARHGYRVEEAADGPQAKQLAEHRTFDVAVVHMVLPTMSGMDLLREIKADSDCEVILLTGHGTIETAVEAMKLGACDFLSKPVRLAELEAAVKKASEAARLRKENRRIKAVIQRHNKPANMIGETVAMEEVYRLIKRAGPTDKPILIQGESGTGKELVARALHQASPRAGKPLVVVNCAALPELLLESELFGHEKGSFTGATSTKPGLFEVADEGTLFIDEIGEMAGGLQAKLLRVLEDGLLRRVGAIKERRVNVRLLTATNRDLAKEVQEGRFREDLYYRIDVMRLQLPPLRHRRDDIPLLTHFFVGHDWTIDDDAMEAMCRFEWPGNVRQLINAVDRAKIMSDDQTIRLAYLPLDVADGYAAGHHAIEGNAFSLDAMKRRQVELVLAREQGNKTRAARALGVSRRSLYRLLDKYEIMAG